MMCDDEKEEPCLRQPATPQPFCDTGDSYRWFVVPYVSFLSVFYFPSVFFSHPIFPEVMGKKVL